MIGSVSIKSGALADPKASELDKLKAAAKQFESVFTRQMLKSMRAAKLSEDDLFGSDATDQFRDMQDSNFADQMSGKGSLGIGDLLVKQFEARVSKTAPGAAASAATGTGTTGDAASAKTGTGT